jgi:Mg-chelatase subunit ChlD
VVKAAGGLLSSLATGRDRAFLVSFGAEPELVTQTTAALDRVQDGLSELEPKGMTPLWASITLALEELGRSRGKRALIVVFDGADEDGGRAYREALARARVAGLPVYMIKRRSAYLLTYYPTVPLASGGRRQVEVQVKRKGVVVRSVSGYEAGR